MRNTPSEFSLLCRDRDHAAYGVVGAATVALAFLNLKEVPSAVRTLLEALTMYREADERITAFHKSQTQKKENQHVSASTTDHQSNAA
jgi:hypothetical protein